jgi:hypothetical protein
VLPIRHDETPNFCFLLFLALIPGPDGIISQRIMARHCEKCGAEIAEGWTVCRSCYEPVKREGVLTRLLRFLGARVSLDKSSPARGTKVNVKLSERIKIRDPFTGELREYHSLDEVPVEYREKVRQAQQAALSGKGGNVISVTDATGKVQTYHSIEEMPPELRALYEKARGEGLVK